MRKAILGIVALALAGSAQADTLTLQIGDRIDVHTGVIVRIDQANVLARLDFGSAGYTSRPTKAMPPMGIGHWTVVVNGSSYGDCELTSTRFNGADRDIAVTFGCAP